MNGEQSRAWLLELGDALMKSWWTVVAGVCCGLAGGAVAVHYIPKVYQAATKIRIAPQSIPEDFVKSTVTDDMSERLMEIEEAVLSRTYMDQLIESNFPPPPDEASRESLMRQIRSRVSVVRANQESRLCALVYRDTQAKRTADVINQLTTLYVEQNKEFRSGQAENTRETFEQLATKAKQELDAVEAELAEFNTLHRHETGSFLDANLQLLETQRRDLEANQRNQSTARLKLDELETKRAQGNWGGLVLPEGTVRDPRARRILDLQHELEALRARYVEGHPDIVKKQRELDDLLASATTTTTKDDGTPAAPRQPVDPELAALESQISAQQREMATLKSEESALRREIGRIEARITQTPDVQSQLSILDDRHRVAEERYRDLKDKSERARGSAFLEHTDQGQRLEVIEWAQVPFRPRFPDPLYVYAVGLAAGLLLFVGPLALRCFMNPIVSSEASLRTLVDVPLLVSVPRIPTRESAGRARRRLLKNVGFSVLSTAALAAVVVLLG